MITFQKICKSFIPIVAYTLLHVNFSDAPFSECWTNHNNILHSCAFLLVECMESQCSSAQVLTKNLHGLGFTSQKKQVKSQQNSTK